MAQPKQTRACLLEGNTRHPAVPTVALAFPAAVLFQLKLLLVQLLLLLFYLLPL
jgi:hypothetical protein